MGKTPPKIAMDPGKKGPHLGNNWNPKGPAKPKWKTNKESRLGPLIGEHKFFKPNQ